MLKFVLREPHVVHKKPTPAEWAAMDRGPESENIHCEQWISDDRGPFPFEEEPAQGNNQMLLTTEDSQPRSDPEE
ncbi:LOW QUALITY PROTEIN: hypothetical protein KIPB_002463 [Kipferlia bialata]|uniref:Uncharacterized protein n=1 Tax=Kipferlia bialata TaxID=797122 RepID=A0A9K3CQM3_9EUKA|nr:LOW QUALITY PROTEIN: hypothetical protein KIPB_002463 [Kipferlia bialata]